jgi:DNA mismatch endonuclease (patch repair protein)
MDIMSPARRSALMSKIQGRDTKPELAVRHALHGLGYRYRLHVKELPGSPDLVFPSRGKVLFVHGCFWHRHDCPEGRVHPKSNIVFWTQKLRGNQERDGRTIAKLRALGWSVSVVWECQIRQASWLPQTIRFLERQRTRQ